MSNKTVSMVKAKPERLNISKAKHICKTQPTHKTQPIKKTQSSRKEQLVRKIESTDKIQHTDKEKPMHEINLIHKKKHTYKTQPMYKSVVISPNSAGGRSIKITPTTINQNRKLKSVFDFQSQPDILKLISLKALPPLGYSHSNRFYLT